MGDPISHYLPNEDATARLGKIIAEHLVSGDIVLLSGDIGAGKTCMARAIIRSMQATHGIAETDIPSPTFTLVQSYEVGDIEILHADLYRLTEASEIDELGLLDTYNPTILLVEWPDRFASEPDGALNVHFQVLDEGRRVHLSSTDDRWHMIDFGDVENG